MSNKNPEKMTKAAWFKYSMIAALLLLAPITLVHQIVLPVVTA
jgi:hypothetical protein